MAKNTDSKSKDKMSTFKDATSKPSDKTVMQTPDQIELENQIIADMELAASQEAIEAMEKKLAGSHLTAHIQASYQESKDARASTEKKWLQAFRDVRGQHSPRQKALIRKQQVNQPNASSAFIKVTKTKGQQAYGQVTEIIFADNKFPIGVQPTPVPEGTVDVAHVADENAPELDVLANTVGFKGDGREVAPGANEQTLMASAKSMLGNLLQGKKILPGSSNNPEDLKLTPAETSAAEMEKLIHDQLLENKAEEALRNCAWECVHLGTGCIKGPMTTEKVIHKWVEVEGIDLETGEPTMELEYKPDVKLFPEISSPSIWNIYNDPRATRVSNSEYLIERHLVGPSELRSWKKKPGFNIDAINRVLDAPTGYAQEHWEEELTDSASTTVTNRYEILEYWGYVDETLAAKLGLKFNSNTEMQINAFVWKDELLKVVVNPFIPTHIPYYLVPYEEVMYQIWGVGLPENMKDAQQLMNAHWRAAIDNLNLAGNVVMEINDDSLVSGQDMRIYPGKQFRTTGPAGQTMFPIKFTDTSQSHMVAFDKARQLGDEASGILSFGQGGVNLPSGVRTSSQTSMLLQGSAQTIKTVIKNFDHYLLEPLGQGMYAWNMQFNKDLPKIRGDLDIVSRGTSSLVQKEVMSQRLIGFSQLAGSNPVMAPKVDFDYILKEFAKSLSLDPDKVINDPKKAQLQAELMATAQGGGNAVNQGNSPDSQQPGNPSVASSNGVTGAGGGAGGQGVDAGPNSAGGVPQPGEAGFSASS